MSTNQITTDASATTTAQPFPTGTRKYFAVVREMMSGWLRNATRHSDLYFADRELDATRKQTGVIRAGVIEVTETIRFLN